MPCTFMPDLQCFYSLQALLGPHLCHVSEDPFAAANTAAEPRPSGSGNTTTTPGRNSQRTPEVPGTGAVVWHRNGRGQCPFARRLPPCGCVCERLGGSPMAVTLSPFALRKDFQCRSFAERKTTIAAFRRLRGRWGLVSSYQPARFAGRRTSHPEAGCIRVRRTRST